MTTKMTNQDLLDAHEVADKIIALMVGLRGPCAVASCALALAAVTSMAGCGPRASIGLFRRYLEDLEKAQGTNHNGDNSDVYPVLGKALAEERMLSLVRFSNASPEERNAMMDRIIQACGQ